MSHSSTVSSKGQITLPKPLRDRHHLTAGETVLILDTPEGILVRHGRANLRGMLKGQLDSDGFEKALKQLRKECTL